MHRNVTKKHVNVMFEYICEMFHVWKNVIGKCLPYYDIFATLKTLQIRINTSVNPLPASPQKVHFQPLFAPLLALLGHKKTSLLLSISH